MKKLLLFLVLFATTTLAFAQGKIVFGNDSLHLVCMTTDTDRLLPPDVGLAGQPVPPFGVLPSGPHLVVDLWAGTASGLLAKVATTTFSSAAGRFGPLSITLPGGLPGGVPDFFQVQVYDQLVGSYAAAAASFLTYYGESPIFTCIPNSGVGYNSIVDNGPPSDSTWFPGPTPIPGGRVGFYVQMNPVPEPGALALAGLGAALWAGLRRHGRLTAS